jgi:23S rRNA (uracil1939-C5)-methyltransferase
MADKKEIDIYAMAYGGEGIGKLEGKVCFIENALPGEKVTFIINENKKNFLRGMAIDILEASDDRIKPLCPYYGQCGGCQYQHITYEKELLFKVEQVTDAMNRIGGINEINNVPIMPSDNCYAYRSSVTVHRAKKGYGYFSKGNKSIIEIGSCSIAEKAINNKIPELFALCKKKDVTIKSDSYGNTHISNQPGERFFIDKFLGCDITFSPLAFSQANPGIASSMIRWIRDSIGLQHKKTLFDLFCGVGAFGILLRDLFRDVIGIDNSSISIDCAVRTKKSLNANNIKFYCSDANKAFPEFYNKKGLGQSIIIIDPPRSGLNNSLAEYMSEIEDAEELYYISCDPYTLARDSRIIISKNKWRLEKMTCFDMFARTKHIETIAVFKKRDQL